MHVKSINYESRYNRLDRGITRFEWPVLSRHAMVRPGNVHRPPEAVNAQRQKKHSFQIFPEIGFLTRESSPDGMNFALDIGSL
jgi:hypothetical protein